MNSRSYYNFSKALNSTSSVEDRKETIEEFTGPLGKGEIEMLEEEWGTAEYFEKRGEKRGEKLGAKRERENVIKKTINILKKLGMSDEEIQQHLKDEELVTD